MRLAYILGNVLDWVLKNYNPDETAMTELCSILEEGEA